MREDLRVMELVKQEAQAKGHENKLIKEELNQYILRERDYQQTVEDSRTALEHKSSTHQEEIRALRRKLDEALF